MKIKSVFLNFFLFAIFLFGWGFMSASAEVDIAAPTIESLELTPAQVDTTESEQKVLIKMHVKDNLTGINNLNLTFASPSGNNSKSAGFYFNQFSDSYVMQSNTYPSEPVNALVSGSSTDGIFQVELTLPQYSETGIWKLQYISVSDKVNNYGSYSSWDNFGGLNIPTEISNSSAQSDAAAPTIESLELIPAQVDTTNGEQKVLIKMHIKDNLTGINNLNLTFASPSGNNSKSAGFYFNQFSDSYMMQSGAYPSEPSNALISGSGTDGIFQVELTLPQYSETGIWKLQYISVSDKLGNNGNYSSWDNFGGLNISTEISNSSAQSDAAAPTIESLELTPAQVDTTNGEQKVLIKMHVKDNLTGINNLNLTFASPSGNNSKSAGFYYNQFSDSYMMQSGAYPSEPTNALISGSGTDGIFQVELTLPQFSETGIWKLQYISVSDKVNNYGSYSSWDNFGGLNIPWKIYVNVDPNLPVEEEDTTPPVTTIEFSNATGENGWHTSDVLVSLSAADPISNCEGGLSCPPDMQYDSANVEKIQYKIDDQDDWSLYENPFYLNMEGEHVLRYRSSDFAGYYEPTKEFSFKIDKTLPEISIISPEENKEYLLNEELVASWNASDEVSGLTSQDATFENGELIVTSQAGEKTFTVTAKDLAGNTSIKSVKYFVTEMFAITNVSLSKEKEFKAGSAIPIKYEIAGSSGDLISGAQSNVYLNDILQGAARFDESDSHYIFNLKTKGLQKGMHLVKIMLESGEYYEKEIFLK